MAAFDGSPLAAAVAQKNYRLVVKGLSPSFARVIGKLARRAGLLGGASFAATPRASMSEEEHPFGTGRGPTLTAFLILAALIGVGVPLILKRGSPSSLRTRRNNQQSARWGAALCSSSA